MSDNPRVKFSKVILPNGMDVFCIQKEEVFIIYEQIRNILKMELS